MSLLVKSSLVPAGKRQLIPKQVNYGSLQSTSTIDSVDLKIDTDFDDIMENGANHTSTFDSFQQPQELKAVSKKEEIIIKDLVSQLIPITFAIFINMLDACTFGTIFFPNILGNTTGMVFELFILSTVISQAVMNGCSNFTISLGTSMAENIPFVHTISNGIFDALINEPNGLQRILPTALAAVAISTVLNGIIFLLVGHFKLGNALHFFPRYIILGMNAGFGIFLINAGFEISTGAATLSFHTIYELSSVKYLQLAALVSMEMLLRIISFLGYDGMIISLIMLLIPIVFFICIYLSNISVHQARTAGWLFPYLESFEWHDTWNDFNWRLIDGKALVSQFPTIISLAFFTIILVPIRIPSLSLETGEDVDFDNEIVCQGIGNLVSGLIGAPHNYLSYSNSVFFHMLNGKGKTSRQAVLAVTAVLFFIGPCILNVIPKLMAGIIMLHLGIDLLVSALLQHSKSLDNLEYSCMLFVGLVVSVYGFVQGLGAGLILACVTFVIASSRESNVRSIITENYARSNTEWSIIQRKSIDNAIADGTLNTSVISLHGHLFFGNIQRVVRMIEDHAVERSCKNIVLDCSFVTGADINAVSALTKMKSNLMSPTYLSTLKERVRLHHMNGSEAVGHSTLDPFNSQNSTSQSFTATSGDYYMNSLFHRHKPNHHDGLLQKPSPAGFQFSNTVNVSQNTVNPLVKSVKTDALLSPIRESSDNESSNGTNSPSKSTGKTKPSRSRSFSWDENDGNHHLSNVSSRRYDVDHPISPVTVTFAGLSQSLQLVFLAEELNLQQRGGGVSSWNSAEDLETAEDAVVGYEDDFHLHEDNERSHGSNKLLKRALLSRVRKSIRLPRTFFPDVNSALHCLEMSLLDNHQAPQRMRSTSMQKEFHVNNSTSDDSIAAGSPRSKVRRSQFNTMQNRIIDALYDLGGQQWDNSDAPALKRLAKKLLENDVVELGPGEKLWDANSEAKAMGLLLNGSLDSKSENGAQQKIQAPAIIGLGCMIGDVNHSRTITAVVLLLPVDELRAIMRDDKVHHMLYKTRCFH